MTELSHHVSELLKNNNPRMWSEAISAEEYTTFSRRRLTIAAQAIHNAIGSVQGNNSFADEALEETNDFIDKTMDEYEGKRPLDTANWAFAVPARTTRSQNDDYASEITPYLPILDPAYGVDANVRQRAIVGLPPIVLDRYRGDARGSGVLAYVPMYEDIWSDVGSSSLSQAEKVARIITNKTTDFLSSAVGVSLVGLGATLPIRTRLGKTVETPEVMTTTGHGGTVYLIGETVKKALEFHQDIHPKIGVIGGAGSIGKATVEYLQQQYPEMCIQVQDKNYLQLLKIADKRQWSESVQLLMNHVQVLQQSDVIVSATTTPIHLDEIDPERHISLHGKTIIDDSQPGCFDRTEIEARGGNLIWVVGYDGSEGGLLKRLGGYGYGNEAGLNDSRYVWGCEAEVAAIALTRRDELAVKEHVTADRVRALGSVCRSIGITVAEPQSYGRSVQLRH